VESGRSHGQETGQGSIGMGIIKHIWRKLLPHSSGYILLPRTHEGTAVARCLRCCTASRKVAGSIPAGVSVFFIDIKFFRSHYDPGVDSASNRNEYQDYYLEVKAACA